MIRALDGSAGRRGDRAATGYGRGAAVWLNR
jgi:hypothetical protein